MSFSALVLVLVAVATSVNALKLPSYIKACKEDDPNLNKCALESARAALPSLLNGDKKYNVPSLNPLLVDKAEIPGNNLDLTFTNAKIHGIKDLNIRAISFDPKKQHVEMDFVIPVVTIDSDYKINGKILVLPIRGNGKANITLTDMELMYKADYTKEKDDKGDEHLQVTNPSFDHKESRAYIRLENLFDGDMALSDATHKFLNENWQEVVKEMAPPMIEVLKQISSTLLNNIGTKVPYNEFWAH